MAWLDAFKRLFAPGGPADRPERIGVDELKARLPKVALPTDEPIYLVCRSGSRSARAARTLSRRGVAVVDVSGGTMAWSRKGHRLHHPR